MFSTEFPQTRGFSYDIRDISQTIRYISWLGGGNFLHRLRFAEWSEFEESVRDSRDFVNSLRGSALDRPRRFSANLLDELEGPMSSEAAIDTQLRKDTTRLATSLLQSYRPQDFSQWGFVPKHIISSELTKVGLTPRSQEQVDIDEPVSGIPDVALFSHESEMQGEDKKAPMSIIEIKHPHARLVPDELRSSSAGEIASYFNHEFEKHNAENVSHPARRFGQSLCYAMHSRSGCGMLWTHNQALFFYVDKVEMRGAGHERSERVCVRVSRLFTCGASGANSVTAIHAIIAWILKSRELARVDNSGSRKRRLMELCRCLEHVGAESMFTYPAVLESGGGSPVALRTRSSASGSASGRSASAVRNGARETWFVEAQVQEWTERFMDSINRQRLRSIVPYISQRRDDALVLHAFRARKQLIGIGRAGIVVRSEAMGTAVALKYWNTAFTDSFDMLANEIAMYCEMERTSANSLGRTVPKLVGIGMHYWVGPVLLTEIVGDAVHRFGSDLKIGNEVLADADKAAMLENVLQCVKLLRGDGLRHGDIAFRNMRARKGEDGVLSVWLLDFGLASLRRTDLATYNGEDVEESKCREIFSGLL